MTTRILEKTYVEALNDAGYAIPPAVQGRYDRIEWLPSPKEMERFHIEYSHRLTNLYGGADFSYLLKVVFYRALFRRAFNRMVSNTSLTLKTRALLRTLSRLGTD
jgi:hypothetical protein